MTPTDDDELEFVLRSYHEAVIVFESVRGEQYKYCHSNGHYPESDQDALIYCHRSLRQKYCRALDDLTNVDRHMSEVCMRQGINPQQFRKKGIDDMTRPPEGLDDPGPDAA